MRTVTITLGGKAYTVGQLPVRKEAAWRAKAETVLGPFLEAAGGLQMDLNSPADIPIVLAKVSALMDTNAALNVVLAYSPDLQAAQAEIDESAYGDEVLTALVALFFGQLRQLERISTTLTGVLPPQSPTT